MLCGCMTLPRWCRWLEWRIALGIRGFARESQKIIELGDLDVQRGKNEQSVSPSLAEKEGGVYRPAACVISFSLFDFSDGRARAIATGLDGSPASWANESGRRRVFGEGTVFMRRGGCEDYPDCDGPVPAGRKSAQADG